MAKVAPNSDMKAIGTMNQPPQTSSLKKLISSGSFLGGAGVPGLGAESWRLLAAGAAAGAAGVALGPPSPDGCCAHAAGRNVSDPASSRIAKPKNHEARCRALGECGSMSLSVLRFSYSGVTVPRSRQSGCSI
jgi:hypothetical protein